MVFRRHTESRRNSATNRACVFQRVMDYSRPSVPSADHSRDRAQKPPIIFDSGPRSSLFFPFCQRNAMELWPPFYPGPDSVRNSCLICSRALERSILARTSASGGRLGKHRRGRQHPTYSCRSKRFPLTEDSPLPTLERPSFACSASSNESTELRAP